MSFGHQLLNWQLMGSDSVTCMDFDSQVQEGSGHSKI